ncbi:hypothetical protein NL108_006792 [Boleophthalmus pectinirostris]|nr:hypothetical protein NL108_006792 [Boleophthalmus pectinirostris]
MTVPERWEPEVAHTKMDVCKEAKALGLQPNVVNSDGNSSEPHSEDKPALATSMLGKRHHSLYANLNGYEGEAMRKNGTDYNILVRQNSELLRALDALEKTCATLREENGLLVRLKIKVSESRVMLIKK